MNLQGNINLLKLNKSCVISVPTKEGGKIRGVFVPIVENDIYLTTDKETGKLNAALLGMSVLERREPSDSGMTHYVRPAVGKNFKEARPEDADRLRQTYLGNMKPLTFDTQQAEAMEQAETVQLAEPDDDLPF